VGGLILAVYFFNYFRSRGLFPLTNHLKLAMFVTNIAMWYVAFIHVKNVIIGLCIWEIIHWMQVTPLTWSYINYRAEHVKNIGRFISKVFSKQTTWILVYISMVLAYGAMGTIPELMGDEFYYKLLTAVLISSGILHFYYEGFMWKVRDKDIQQGMRLQPGKARPLALINPQLKHALLWLFFALPLGWLTYTQITAVRSSLEIYNKIIEVVPRCWYSQYNVAVELDDIGEFNSAVVHYQNSIDVNPEYADSRVHLAKILIGQGA